MKPTPVLWFLSLATSLAFAFPSFVQPPNTLAVLPTDAGPRQISVTGDHAFVPPSETDLRGPCPALNALANYNYLPHHGIVSIAEAMEVSRNVWGFGPDFGLIAGSLALTYGSGDGSSVSLGGAVPPSDSDVSPLDGVGLSGTHNQFEGDSSPTRGDYYEFGGNNHDARKPYFLSLVNALKYSSIVNHRIRRYEQSVATNPYFYYGPEVLVITTATHCFIPGIMANFGDSRPNGSFPQNDTSHVDGYFRNEDDLYQLFGFTRDDNGEVAYRSGHEQIPANWYRRSTDYTHLDAAPCLQAMGQADPSIMIPGGNIGETNTFTPMDISNLTYGVYTEEMLSEWKNLRCFLYQVLVLATPAQGMSMVMFLPGGSIATTLEEWMCPKLEKLNKAMYDRYPGYKRKN